MFDDGGIKRMWGQSPSAAHRSEASAARFQPKKRTTAQKLFRVWSKNESIYLQRE